MNKEHPPRQATPPATPQEGNKELIDIEVAYAIPNQQKIVALQVPINTPIYEAIKLSKICEFFEGMEILKEQNIHNTTVGIFGKKVDPNVYVLKNKDRIEIYRPLTKTPNQKRLERAHTK